MTQSVLVLGFMRFNVHAYVMDLYSMHVYNCWNSEPILWF